MGRWTYFSDQEAQGIEDETMAQLDMARKYAGVPFTITCGLRSASANSALVGAVADSAHLPDSNGLSHAVDLATGNDNILFCVVKGLIQAGFTRIGIYFAPDGGKNTPHHIHVDDDPAKPQSVMWLLQEKN